MINTNLDRTYKASSKGQVDYSPVPDGEYRLKITEISPWVKQTKTIKVIQKDEYGNKILDAQGKEITETIKDCEFYNSNLKIAVVGGEYNGRLVFHTITTHPNMNWTIDNLLYAVGMKELNASQIPAECKGKEFLAKVYTDVYTKKVQNKMTAVEEEVERQINKIKNLKPLPDVEVSAISAVSNLGI